MNRFILFLLLGFLTKSGFSQNISADDLQADAKLLWQALNELHPGLYRHTDTTSLTKAYEQLLQDFSIERNEKEVFLSLSEFVSKIKCGHTYLNPFNQSNEIISSVLEKKVLLPFTFSIIEEKIVIESPLIEGLDEYSVITHINEIELGSIFDRLTNYVKADGNRDRKRLKDLEVHLTSKYEYFDYYFPMIFGFENEVSLTFNDGSEKIIKLLNKEERSEKYIERFPASNSDNYDNLWTNQFYDNYAYLQLGTFVTWRLSFDWEEYLDKFFAELESKGIQNLIIDLRGNEGGLTEVNDYLVNKLAREKGERVFRKPHLSYKKVSENIKPHVKTWNKRFYNTSIWTKRLNTNYRTIKFSANKPKKIKKNKEAYNGQTYMLINESNSSATYILAETCKKNAYTTLVGTETSGTKKGITAGQIFFLTLPNTKIEIDIPLIGRYPMTELPDEGIKPDILIEQTLNRYSNNQDEQLEQVIKMIGT